MQSGNLTPAPVSDAVARLLRDLIHEQTGLFFEDDRLGLMLEKLADRMAATACKSPLDYYYILKYGETNPAEWQRVLDAFSVQETYFWREMDQIRTLVDVVVPAWFKRESYPLRIWSAACATGEEPYTIAIALQEAGWGNHPIEILASDGSEAALAKVQTGVYRERSFRALPAHLRAKYFVPVPGGSRLEEAIQRKVTFRRANLALPFETAPLAQSPVIFCRNVFIYFSAQSITRVVASFASVMPDDGYLFVGASESLLKLTQAFELQEIAHAFVYVRKSHA
jgi:chemotaxis protein methyltransferase CheR